MKNSIFNAVCKTRYLALLVVLIFTCGNVWGTSVTWPNTTALPSGYTNIAGDANVQIKVSSTNSYTNPIRVYANTTVSIQVADGYTIESVTYEASSTGNYVTYAQNATVSPSVTPTVSSKNVTWSYSSTTTEFTFKPSSQTRSNGITVVYSSTGGGSTCATPTFNNGTGTYNNNVSVTISTKTDGATIHYTTSGTAPTCSTGTTGTSVTINSTGTVLKAIACKDGSDASEVASATYTLKCATPTGLTTGTYVGTQTVTLATATVGANIYYTTDGSNPTASSTHYTAPFGVSSTSTIKAIAIKSGYTNSEVATAAYTITPAFTVTWKNQGTTVTTTNVASGSKPVFPDMSLQSGCGKYTYFYGWAEDTWSDEVTSPGTSSTVKVYKSASEMPNVTGDGVVYHAVWGDSPGGWTKASSVSVGDVIVITDKNDTKELTGIYMPSSTYIGKAESFSTTPNGTYPLTVVTGYNSSGVALKNGDDYLLGSSSNDLSKTTTLSALSSWTLSYDGVNDDWSITNNDQTSRRIRFNGSTSPNRFCTYTSAQTGIHIWKHSAAANCVTSCCTKLGSINGSISLTTDGCGAGELKATWKMLATTGIASQTLKVYDENLDEVTAERVTGITASTSNQTITISGLNPCKEYYVTVENVSSGGEYCDGGLIGTSGSCTTNGYTLTVNKSNVSLNSGSEPTNICSNISATYAASDGYTLPTSISVTNAGAENTGWTWDSSTGALTINKANVTGNVTVTITGAAQSNFINGETVFIQADSKDYSAWKDDACVKAWFNNNWSGGSAETTYWLFDATDADAGKKLFATVVPASGDLNIVQLQRFAGNCLNKWNDNGSVNKASSNGVNTFRSYGSADNNVAWNGSSTILYLYGSQNSWESSLGTFADQGAGVWTATISNYTPDATSKDYKIKTSYNNGWIGNTGSNNNATLSDMIVGSTYNVTATLNVTTHALTMSKTFVKGTVHFDLQGHGSAIADLTNVAAGSKISAPSPAPNETGWDFGGWYKEAGCTNAWNFDSDEVTETMTLYAKWTEKPKYTITLNAGNGTVSEAGWEKDGDVWKQQQSNGDASITFPSASSNCAGWEFQGWATSAANNVSSDPTSKAAGATLVPASNVTYYAVYRQNSTGGTTYNKITDIGDLTTGTYVIKTSSYAMRNNADVICNSTYCHMPESSKSGADASITNSDATLDWTIIKFGSNYAIKSGSKFVGIDRDGILVYDETMHLFTAAYDGTNNRWVFTSTENTSYQLVYDTYFRSLDTQKTAILLYKQGAGLTGNYYTNPTCSDLSITGVADPAAGGSVTLSATSAKSGEKVYAYYTEDPAYRFKSWSVSGTGASISSTTAKFTEITVGSADVTLTANFDARVMYSVTWKANGEKLTGVDLGSASTSVETGEKITNLPPNPSSCDGTSTAFVGWIAESDIWSGKTDDVSAKHIYTAASEIPAVTGAVTYHAVWAQVDSENASWKKVTSVDDLQDGETVAFISAGDGYYLPNKASASGNAPSLGTVTKTSGDIHFVNEMKFTAIYNSMYDGFTFESVSATGKYLWVYNDNKGIYISAIDENKSNSSNIWYLEDFDDANSTSTGYGIGMYATTGTGNYRYLTTYGTSDWRSYKSTGVGTGTPANLLANIYRYANAYKQYLVKCCNTPTLTFAASPYAVIRQDIGGASTTTWAEVDVTFTSNSTGTISAAQYSNATVTNGTAYQLAASKWQVYETTGGTLCGATHAYFEVLTQPSGETPGKGKFHVKTSSGQTGQGTYRIAITQAATDESHGNFCETTVYGFVDVTLRDKFVDNVNGNGTVTRDGHGAQLATPTLSEFGTQEEDACHSERRKLKGWIKETDLKAQYETGSSTRVQTVDGLCETCADGTDQTSLIVAPGTNVTMSGATWYAVWAYER